MPPEDWGSIIRVKICEEFLPCALVAVAAMGRALMTRPKMIMLDEPSLGLSPRFVTDIFEKIENLTKEGVTIMVVEQNAARALEIADRGYVLELGRNRYQGTGQELLENQDVRRMYLGG